MGWFFGKGWVCFGMVKRVLQGFLFLVMYCLVVIVLIVIVVVVLVVFVVGFMCFFRVEFVCVVFFVCGFVVLVGDFVLFGFVY